MGTRRPGLDRDAARAETGVPDRTGDREDDVSRRVAGRRAAATAVVLVAGLGAAAAAFLLGMRAQSPVVRDAVRRLNRDVFNPQQMASAGSAGSPTAVVRHRGRTSGRGYETPVAAVPTGDGFVVALPYGTRADWVRNVLTAGSATLVRDGHVVPVDSPQVVDVDAVADAFSSGERRVQRLFGVRQCLRLRRETAERGTGGNPAPG